MFFLSTDGKMKTFISHAKNMAKRINQVVMNFYSIFFFVLQDTLEKSIVSIIIVKCI